MRVILLRDVRGFGRRGEVKHAKDGYARNFLLPQGFAVIADDAALQKLAHDTMTRKEREESLERACEACAASLETNPIEFMMKSGARGELFGSITADMIREKITSSFPEVPYDAVRAILQKPLKYVGEYAVRVTLGKTEGRARIIVKAD